LAVTTPRAGDSDGKDAVLLVRTYGCHQPADAKASATAEGVIDGKRTSVALDPKATGAEGDAIRQQWPSPGSWGAAVTADDGGARISGLKIRPTAVRRPLRRARAKQ